MKYSLVDGIVQSSITNSLKFGFELKYLTNEQIEEFNKSIVPVEYEGKQLCKRIDLYMEKILKKEDVYKLMFGFIPDVFDCGGGVVIHIEDEKSCNLLPKGDYIFIDNILKANVTEEVLSFIINHEKYHVLAFQNKKKQNEAACDEFAFKQIGAIDKDGNMDTDKVCEIYTELVDAITERNKAFLDVALQQDYCKYVYSSIRKRGCTLDEVKTDVITMILARANKVKHNKYNDVKFVYDKTTHKVVAAKTNRKLTKSVKVAAVAAAVAAAAAGVAYLVKEN